MFNINTATGVMKVKNDTWGFSSTAQLSCSGKLLVGTDEDSTSTC